MSGMIAVGTGPNSVVSALVRLSVTVPVPADSRSVPACASSCAARSSTSSARKASKSVKCRCRTPLAQPASSVTARLVSRLARPAAARVRQRRTAAAGHRANALQSARTDPLDTSTGRHQLPGGHAPTKVGTCPLYRESNQSRLRRSCTRRGLWPSRSAHDAEGYDRARPGYPGALVARIVAESPGLDVLDVGCGTGIAARQFQAAGCTVLGVEPDARMAEFARARGLRVEVATFEAWDPAEPDVRRGDRRPVVALGRSGRRCREGGPGTAPRRAAGDLRPRVRAARRGGRAVRRRLPEGGARLTVHQSASSPPAGPLPGGVRQDRRHDPRDRTLPRTRTVAIRLGAVLHPRPMAGAAARPPAASPGSAPSQLADILGAVGTAIDTLGGAFTMHYTTLATTAVRAGTF